jgi:RHS repeat-associated protein
VDYPSGRRVEYGYDAVGNRRELVDSAKAGAVRWAASAASNAGGSGAWAAGAPDGAAWTPDPSVSGPHWLELTYAQAERAKGVRIHEGYNAPSVGRVDLIEENGTSHTVYEGGDGTTRDGWLTLSFTPTTYPVKRVRVWTVKGPTVASGEEIESVGLEPASVETYAYNAFNQLTTVTGLDGAVTSFGYDENGNQIRKQDASGITQYVYNEDNRLVGIALPGGVSNAIEYDANGLRTKKTDSSGTTSYLLDGMSVVAQYAPDGARQAWYTQSLARIDEVLSVVNGQGKFWYQADALGSTYALANGSGQVVARGGYDVFGDAVAVSGNVGQPFGFTGREHERDSGLAYYRHREYDPSTGRFLRPDPIGQSGGPNYYVLLHGRPTVSSDPSGLFDSMDAYAMKFPFAFLMLAQDLGYLTIEEAVVSIGTQIGTAVTLAEMISAQPMPEIDAESKAKTCAQPREPPKTNTFYRGLSRTDVNELALFGVVQSKFARGGGSMLDAFQVFGLGMQRHTTRSDAINWEEVAEGKSPVGSPFVSVSKMYRVAHDFAHDGPEPGGMVAKLSTYRPGIGPIRVLNEGEYLMFYMIGMPGETLEFTQ